MSRHPHVLEKESPSSLSCNLCVALSYLALFLFTLFALYPISRSVTVFANVRSLLSEPAFLRWLWNSALIALAVTITGVALASIAGYAFSRLRFSGRNGLLVTQLLPAAVLLLPLYLILIKLSLISSYLGLIIIYAATALPFCIWQMKGYYDTIPVSLEEAAKIDGCTRWQSWYLVVLPLSLPGLVNAALFSFITAWAEYVVAVLVLQVAHRFTLPLGLKMFQSHTGTQWDLFAASALLVAVPAVLLFLLLSRFLVSRASDCR